MVGLSLWMVRKNMGNLTLSGQQRYLARPSTSISAAPPSFESDSSARKVMPLYEYLDVSRKEYNEFSEFLASCFALENLLFFVKAIFFRRIVSEIVNDTDQHLENTINTDQECSEIHTSSTRHQTTMEKVHLIKFEYLEELLKDKDKSQSKDKESIQNIAVNIYKKYISIEGEFQVNISADIRDDITEFFKSDHEIQDYLDLFDDALCEVYGMLTNVYRFKFKSNLRYA